MAQHTLQETPWKNVIEPHSSSWHKSRITHEERMLQINELDEWQTHVKENLRIHDTELKRLHDELKDGTNHFKVGDQVLLDKTDPRIAIAKINTSGETPFKVLNVFPIRYSRGKSF
ncbi:hypothetical protein GOBAR_AA12554 [Gossypium barbadense]|uniref:Uncharacterized protein n=1 Tax=Gossypium barbadense TaxID=3634 RepID=A0A2P5XXM4_GOSBA|nr:hypothetical protein GOBAR_AA12554 [Gossypium barbadense]